MMLYFTVKNTFNVEKKLSDIQQKGRFLVYFFSRTLSLAGLEECNQYSTNISDLKVIGVMEDAKDKITIYHCLFLNGANVFGAVDYFLENKKLYFKSKTESHPKRLLLEGIEKMNIIYGVSDEDKGTLNYLQVHQVKDWKKVKSISIEFHLISNKFKKIWYVYVALPKKRAS